MELMSSLLLYVLVAVLPQTLGDLNIKPVQDSPLLKLNSTVVIKKKSVRKPVLLNTNGLPLVNNLTELQSLFTDNACWRCHICMERAIKAHKVHAHVINHHPFAEDLRQDLLTNEITQRTKRNLNKTKSTELDLKTVKKIRSKKNKQHISVTKFDANGAVYALQIKETNFQTVEPRHKNNMTTVCHIYSVKKSFPCDTREGNLLLTVSKRKAIKKKTKKEQEKIRTTATTTEKIKVAIFKKREVDNSQLPENFMPSIEELY